MSAPAAATAATADPARRPSPAVDALVALWVVLWLVVGVWIGIEVWRLGGLSETVASTGRTLDASGQALQSFSGVPLVGSDAAELGTQVRTSARDIVINAGRAGESIRRLALLLGFAIALVPSVPVLLLHLAQRQGRLRGTAARG